MHPLGKFSQTLSQIKPYGGFLWTVDADGGIYEASPYGSGPIVCIKDLPGNGFVSCFSIQETNNGPVLYANNGKVLYGQALINDTSDNPLEIDGNESIISGVLKKDDHFFFITSTAEGLILKCTGKNDWEYRLQGATLFEGHSEHLYDVNNSLWVVTQNKIIIFPSFLSESPLEKVWNPWRVLVTKNGLWYTRKYFSNQGEKQSIHRVTLEGGSIVESQLKDNLPLTTRVGVNDKKDEVAIFSSSSIEVYDSSKILLQSLTGVIEIQNPSAVFISPPIVAWYDNSRRSFYLWTFGKSSLHSSQPFRESQSIMQVLVAYGYLLGVTNDGELWRCDLLR